MAVPCGTLAVVPPRRTGTRSRFSDPSLQVCCPKGISLSAVSKRLRYADPRLESMLMHFRPMTIDPRTLRTPLRADAVQ